MSTSGIHIAYLAAASSIHTARWVNEMSSRGHRVYLITMHPPELTSPIDNTVEIFLLPFSPPAGYYLNRWHLRRLLKRLGPNLLHTHYASGYGTLSRLVGFHPTLLSVWGSDVFEFPKEKKWKEKILCKNLVVADYLASTSCIMKIQTEKFVRPKHPVTVTPFGVDCEKFKPLDIKKDTPEIIIGTVKTLSEKYGVEYLISAFAILAKRQAEMKLRLLIVGEGELRIKLEKLAEKLEIKHQTEFTGKVAHKFIPDYLNRLSVYVALSVSDSESFGVAVLEASACGKPVVVSNVGGLPEVVRDGVTGFIVPNRNPYAASEAVEKLVMNPQLAKQMGNGGRQFVLTNYEWNKTVKIMEELYERILKGQG